MADPYELSPFQKQNVQSWMRGSLASDPKALHPDVAQMVRDARQVAFAPKIEAPGIAEARAAQLAYRPNFKLIPPQGFEMVGKPTSPTGFVMQGEPLPYSQGGGSPRFGVPSTVSATGAPATIAPPPPTSAGPRGGFEPPMGGNVGSALGRALPTVMKGLGAAGTVAQGYNLYNAAQNPETLLGRSVQQLRADEQAAPQLSGPQNLLQKRPGSAVTDTLLDYVPAFAGVLGTMFGAPNRALASAVAPVPDTQPRFAPRSPEVTPAGQRQPPEMNVPRTPAGQRQLPEMNVPRTPAAEEAGPDTVRIYRGGSGGGLTTTYDVSPGAPIGKVLNVEGMAPGLTPQEHLYNLQALKSANIAANQQRAAANAIIRSFRQRIPMDNESGQFLAGLAQAAGKGVEPIRPQLQGASQGKQPDPVAQAGYTAALEIGQVEAEAQSRAQQLLASNPRLTPEKIAADPQVQRLRARQQLIQNQYNRMVELLGKRLPTIDQTMATGSVGGE